MMWKKGKILGKGSFGTVFFGEPIDPTAPPIAIKTSRLATSSSLQLERRVLDLLRGCPEIVSCLGSTVTIESLPAEDLLGEELTPVYNLFLEYAAGGTLKDLIEQGSGLRETECRRCVGMILRGLSFIHRRGMVHCDLKPGNILVFPGEGGTDDYQLKIADFGLVKQGRGSEEQRRSPFRGTPIYMSPESVAFGEIKTALDIWSLGCIVIQMITGKPVWWKKCRNRKELMVAILKESPMIPEDLSEEGKDFLRRCFERNPRDRWTAEMLLDHPFVAAVDEVRQLVCETIEPPGSPKSHWDILPSGLHNHSFLSGNGLPPLGWCSFMPNDQRSNQSTVASDGIPPPGWCSFSSSDSLHLPGESLLPPGWCSFSTAESKSSVGRSPFSSLDSLHLPGQSLLPPGWCSFSTAESKSSVGRVPASCQTQCGQPYFVI